MSLTSARTHDSAAADEAAELACSLDVGPLTKRQHAAHRIQPRRVAVTAVGKAVAAREGAGWRRVAVSAVALCGPGHAGVPPTEIRSHNVRPLH